MNKDRLQQIIAEYMPHRWAELIEPMAEAILDNLHDDKPKEKPEWEEKLSRVFDTLSPLPVECLIDFIKQEFKSMGKEVRIEMMRRDAFPWQETVDIVVNEALRKRGVE
jgi:hypothetical protein